MGYRGGPRRWRGAQRFRRAEFRKGDDDRVDDEFARRWGAADVASVARSSSAAVRQTREFALRPFRLKVRHHERDAVRPTDINAVLIDGWVVMSNFSLGPTTAEVECGGKVLSVPINGRSTRVLRAQ